MLLSKLCLSCHHQKPRQKPRKGSINTKIRKYSLWLVDHWITDIWVSNLCQAILYIKRKLVLCRMRKRMLPCPIPSILPFSGMLSILGCYQLNVISKDHAENEHGRCGPRIVLILLLIDGFNLGNMVFLKAGIQYITLEYKLAWHKFETQFRKLSPYPMV